MEDSHATGNSCVLKQNVNTAFEPFCTNSADITTCERFGYFCRWGLTGEDANAVEFCDSDNSLYTELCSQIGGFSRDTCDLFSGLCTWKRKDGGAAALENWTTSRCFATSFAHMNEFCNIHGTTQNSCNVYSSVCTWGRKVVTAGIQTIEKDGVSVGGRCDLKSGVDTGYSVFCKNNEYNENGCIENAVYCDWVTATATYLSAYTINVGQKVFSYSIQYSGSDSTLSTMQTGSSNRFYYTTLEDCAQACSETSGCVGFVDNRESSPLYCVLKNINTLEADADKDYYML